MSGMTIDDVSSYGAMAAQGSALHLSCVEATHLGVSLSLSLSLSPCLIVSWPHCAFASHRCAQLNAQQWIELVGTVRFALRRASCSLRDVRRTTLPPRKANGQPRASMVRSPSLVQRTVGVVSVCGMRCWMI